jgi:hypothetical protein
MLCAASSVTLSPVLILLMIVLLFSIIFAVTIVVFYRRKCILNKGNQLKELGNGVTTKISSLKEKANKMLGSLRADSDTEHANSDGSLTFFVQEDQITEDSSQSITETKSSSIATVTIKTTRVTKTTSSASITTTVKPSNAIVSAFDWLKAGQVMLSLFENRDGKNRFKRKYVLYCIL